MIWLDFFDLFKTQLGRFRFIAFLEGVSFILLVFVAMPLKYLYDMPQPNKVIGMAHGVLFIAYVFTLIFAAQERNWKLGKAFLAFVISFIPFGTFWGEYKLFKG